VKLIIDIGNTAVKIALFKGKQLQNTAIFDECTLKNILGFVNKQDISSTIISSVKDINADIKKLIHHFDALFLDFNTLLPIVIKYKTRISLARS